MSYTHFTEAERICLQMMSGMGLERWNMAVVLGKDRSSISRELRRNRAGGVYTGVEAQERARARRAETKPSPKRGNAELMGEALRMFREDHSPDQISGRLKVEYPESPEKWVSHETIYRYLYGEMAAYMPAENKEMKAHFRHPRVKRKARSGRKDGRGRIIGRVSIKDRPAEADLKAAAGHWDEPLVRGDTVEGAGKTAYIATFVDKSNKLLVARKMDNKAAASLNDAAAGAFRRVPHAMRKTLTTDNGKEFAAHEALGARLGMPVFFAHPYHSWERGLNEHTNGLLRQYFPKGMKFDDVTQRALDIAVKKINNRPRKSLGYRTPNEVFFMQKIALQI